MGAGNAGAASAAVPAGFEDTLVTKVSGPTAIAFTPDRRLLIATRTGQLRVYRDGALVGTPALDISDKLCSNLERGLVGLAVDPAFTANHHIYVYYTFNKFGACDDSTRTPVNRVSRFTLSDANLVDRASELVLIDNIPSPQGQHNSGDLHFGKDNYLYVSVGDGNCDYAGDSGCGPFNDAARDPHVLLGKILRITPGGGVPPTNPFLGADSMRCNLTGRTSPGKRCRETYASGLRNPFRFAFDPNAAGTRFFINDVGHVTWEEVNLGQAGADYGWNVREGHCARASMTNCGPPPPGMTNPIYDYPHNSDCTAITGAAFVPNSVWPAQYNGGYLFADFACGKIFLLKSSGAGGYAASEFANGLGMPVVMAFGPHGTTQALYYSTFNQGGEVRRIAFTGALNRAPVARASANPRYGDLPLTVTFDAAGSSDPDGDALTYEWDFGDGSAPVTGVRRSHTYRQSGTYVATLRVFDGRGATGTARLRIDAGNHPPTPAIELPGVDTRFRVGQTIRLQGSATDPEDGALPASALSWVVRLRHNSHMHPFLGPVSGNGIPFTAPAPEDLSAAATSDLRITLTATDSRGLRQTTTRILRPRTVNVTLASQPSGLRLEADGFPHTAPTTLVSWEGYTFRVQAPAQTDDSGQPWTFSSWSDGGAAAHSITTPATATTYTATFRPKYPNVLFIVTDDQRPTGTLDVMPKTRHLFGDRGTYFPNAFATTPLCCPSRASIFTGRYAHNHGVRDNDRASALDHSATLQRRLRSVGYTTAIFGKFLNQWDLSRNPPHFDKWSIFDSGNYTNMPANEQGQRRTIPDYVTTYVADKGTQFILDAEKDDRRPWFLYLAPPVPHKPFIPEPKYQDASIPEFVPNPAYFEPDVSDKPPYVGSVKTTPEEAQRRRAAQLRSLMSVDDLVGRVFGTLQAMGETEDTLAFFVSDNGYVWGEHRLLEKRHPYTHSVMVPFFMRWTGKVRQGAVDPRLVANIDFAPTVLDAAGLVPDRPVDGRSLLRGGTRDRILLERLVTLGELPNWASIRTATYQYTEYYRSLDLTSLEEPFFREYYDLVADPWQLTNYLGDDDPTNDPPSHVLDALRDQLVSDFACSGRGGVAGRPACP